jgi:hypothetical protein
MSTTTRTRDTRDTDTTTGSPHVYPSSPPGSCPDCGGPSLSFKGSRHGWRCARCVEHAIGLDRDPAPYVPDWMQRDERLAAEASESLAYSTASTVGGRTATREDRQP